MGANAISKSFTEKERERFHNLLKLAAESPFEGERANALAAAQRMASSFGLTLEEAAAGGKPDDPRQREAFTGAANADGLRRFAQAFHLMDYYLHADKQRRTEALAAARARGLDAGEGVSIAAKPREGVTSRRRMDPLKHAAVLLQETSLSFHEVAEITGLDIYKVVGLKLKMRPA